MVEDKSWERYAGLMPEESAPDEEQVEVLKREAPKWESGLQKARNAALAGEEASGRVFRDTLKFDPDFVIFREFLHQNQARLTPQTYKILNILSAKGSSGEIAKTLAEEAEFKFSFLNQVTDRPNKELEAIGAPFRVRILERRKYAARLHRVGLVGLEKKES